jgi:hypothetical protein
MWGWLSLRLWIIINAIIVNGSIFLKRCRWLFLVLNMHCAFGVVLPTLTITIPFQVVCALFGGDFPLLCGVVYFCFRRFYASFAIVTAVSVVQAGALFSFDAFVWAGFVAQTRRAVCCGFCVVHYVGVGFELDVFCGT